MSEVSRRVVIGGMSAAAAGAFVAPHGAGAAAPAGKGTKLTAQQALALLKEGNQRFIADRPTSAPMSRQRRLEIAKGQQPFAVLVSCSDSRVGPEQLFGRGLGELFIVRNAGNTVASTQAMGSVEYAVAELGVPLIVVLGHERCGAVAAAASVVEQNSLYPGSIGRMVEPIVPAVLAARGRPGDLVDNSVRENVRRVVRDLRTSVEPMLLDPQKTGRLKVVGAYYDLDTGVVDFFDES
ncbi:MAG TPA: carbonic anhydrase [Allosphingosinicella sp.]|nr:carbonic anhydrase [Allosphingosinicella sp.]